MRTRRKVLLVVAVVVTLGLGAGLAWFQPWKLFVDRRVDERLPVAVTPVPVVVPTTTGRPTRGPSAPDAVPTVSSAPPAVNTVVRQGRLISHEHETRGRVSIVRLADGSHVLTLRDLDTSDGPDVEVWLTDAPVLRGEKGWYVFDDGAHTSLGDLKGNQGNQVYRIPRWVDLSRYSSVSLWCARFDVSFGAAELSPAV